MNFISTSKENILSSLENVSLEIKRDYHFNTTLRDYFVNFFKTKQVQKEKILDGITFQINVGDHVGILGINGSGKTTLCKTISGMFKPTSGHITTIQDSLAIYNNGVTNFFELSGRENIQILISLFYPNEIGNKSFEQKIIDFSELKELIDSPFKNYSNGMKARIFLSVALQKSADLLIFDESFTGADQFFSKKCLVQAKKMIQASKASLIVSHSVDHVRETCNKVIVLKKGKITFEGDVEAGIKFFHSQEDKASDTF